MMKKNPPLGW